MNLPKAPIVPIALGVVVIAAGTALVMMTLRPSAKLASPQPEPWMAGRCPREQQVPSEI